MDMHSIKENSIVRVKGGISIIRSAKLADCCLSPRRQNRINLGVYRPNKKVLLNPKNNVYCFR